MTTICRHLSGHMEEISLAVLLVDNTQDDTPDSDGEQALADQSMSIRSASPTGSPLGSDCKNVRMKSQEEEAAKMEKRHLGKETTNAVGRDNQRQQDYVASAKFERGDRGRRPRKEYFWQCVSVTVQFPF